MFMKGGCTGWIDNDDSGNYDPKADRISQQAKSSGNGQTLGTASPCLAEPSESRGGTASSLSELELSDGSDTEELTSERHKPKNKLKALPKSRRKIKQRVNNGKNKAPNIQGDFPAFSGMGAKFDWRKQGRNSTKVSSSRTTKQKSTPIRRRKSKPKQRVRRASPAASSKIITIRTAFCHPITFNHIPDAENQDPCSWCDSPFFGLSGHGFLEVRVLKPLDDSGEGYEEISDGHTQEGQPCTKMCMLCTYARIRIMTCAKHDIQPIPGLDPQRYDYRSLYKSLEALKLGKNGDEGDNSSSSDGGGETLAMTTKWCSICPAPAFYKCCTKQQFNERGEAIDADSSPPTPVNGCGLLLCEVCEDLVFKIAETPNRNQAIEAVALTRTIRRAGEECMKLSYPEGVRADAEFLTPEGELLTRMQRRFGSS